MSTETTGRPVKARANIGVRTLRRDAWWVQPAITFGVLILFIIYATFRAFQNKYYFREPYISPLYSPCLSTSCTKTGAPHIGIFRDWWILTPAIFILVFPLGFRLTCYYYRKAYYRSFWLSPPACAVAEPHGRYTGETRFPLVFQNIHRYFFLAGLVFNSILTYDAIIAFRDQHGHWFHMGVGTVVLLLNAAFLWLYSLSCHSCRHIVGGRLNNFSKHPMRYKFWTLVSRLNTKHMQFAWVSLLWVAFTDFYVLLVSSGHLHDVRFF